MNLKTYLAAVRVYRKTFVVVTGTLLALGLSWLLLTPRYVSTTQLLVSIQGSTTAAAYQNDEVVAGRVNSYIALLTSDVVMKRVIDKLGLPLTTRDLAAKVSATNVPPQTSVIDVAVTDESPERAQRIADTLAREFVSYADALETPTGEDGQKVHTTVVTAASEPHARIAERVILAVLVALAGLLLAGAAVWIRSLTDPVVRTVNRATAVAGVAALGRVTSAAAKSVGDLEGYRRLRTRLRSLINGETANGRGSVLVLTTAGGEIDTVAIASNLGRAIESAGSRSIVLDAGIPVTTEPTSDCARDNNGEDEDNTSNDEESVPDNDQRAAQDNDNADNEAESNDGSEDASVLPSIRRGGDGFADTLALPSWSRDSDLAATTVAGRLLDQLRNRYAFTIVAAPPVLKTTIASVVSEHADAVLLVLSLGITRRRDLSDAADSLQATGAPLTGAVLADTKPHEISFARTTIENVLTRSVRRTRQVLID